MELVASHSRAESTLGGSIDPERNCAMLLSTALNRVLKNVQIVFQQPVKFIWQRRPC